jgi:enamine deaminase RidA (YjgF/YER057c/UK114 family)
MLALARYENVRAGSRLGMGRLRYGESVEERRHHSTETEFEARVGYDRAVRVGHHVHVAGTLGMGPDGHPPAGSYAQSVAALERIRLALEAVGSSLTDVVRTRMYVVDLAANHEGVGRAHNDYFADIRPVSTMVGISALIAPEFVVEIEVEALTTA